MFGSRHKRTTRDRSHGLVFQWRLPVGNTMSFCAAILVVSLITAGLAASVRVRMSTAGQAHHGERRGTLIVVPSTPEWDSLRTMAAEAGPFPVREDPSRDPAVVELIRERLAAATPPGYRYDPSYQKVDLSIPNPAAESAARISRGTLPPLPEMDAPAPLDPAAPGVGLVVLAANGPQAQAPDGAAPAGALPGNRYLLFYAAEGRVTRATTVFCAPEAQADATATELWLRRGLIQGGEKDGGCVAVEISSGGGR